MPGKSGIIALAGPALGTVAALLCFLLAETASSGYFRYLLLALAYFGCFLNLINLIPVGFLDGAKVADAIPRWMNVLGLLVVAAVVLFFGNPIGLIFLILGIFHTIGRFRRGDQMSDPAQVAASQRLGLGAAYVAILLVAAAGMSIANTSIVNSNSVPGVKIRAPAHRCSRVSASASPLGVLHTAGTERQSSCTARRTRRAACCSGS